MHAICGAAMAVCLLAGPGAAAAATGGGAMKRAAPLSGPARADGQADGAVAFAQVLGAYLAGRGGFRAGAVAIRPGRPG